jgi:transcriptional regulator GlxA family with amidase domain
MGPSPQVAREIPVFAVLPANVLLLDVAGPMEVLRKANLEQGAVRFVVTFVGPAPSVASSIGLSVAGIAPLPERLPDGAFVLLSGSVTAPMAATSAAAVDAAGLDREIVAWLQRVVRPSTTVASICSGALLAARAGLLDGKTCTTAPRLDRRTERARAAGARRRESAVRDRWRTADQRRSHVRRRPDAARRGRNDRSRRRRRGRPLSGRLPAAERR